jgi:hypothetical protein
LRHSENRLQFAARYLNAVRIGSTALDNWLRNLRPGDEPTPPNRCASCPRQARCFEDRVHPFSSQRITGTRHEAQQCHLTLRWAARIWSCAPADSLIQYSPPTRADCSPGRTTMMLVSEWHGWMSMEVSGRLRTSLDGSRAGYQMDCKCMTRKGRARLMHSRTPSDTPKRLKLIDPTAFGPNADVGSMPAWVARRVRFRISPSDQYFKKQAARSCGSGIDGRPMGRAADDVGLKSDPPDRLSQRMRDY